MCPEDKGLGGLGLAGRRQVSCQLGASHCGLSVVDFQAQRLYKSNWWVIKLQVTHGLPFPVWHFLPSLL
jgi:hypothetical protein